MITQSTQKKLALLIIASLVLTILIAIASVRTTQKANVWITGQLKVEKYGDTYAIKGSVYNAGERTAYDVKITIKTGALKEIIIAKTNPDFDDEKELVIRLGEYASPRTFAVRADKAAKHLERELIKALQMGSPMEVDIEEAVE